jgi:hypothetical protein
MCIASRERRIDAEARARRLTGSSAPLLRAATEDTSRTIATVYEVWRSHHARCATCGTYDWFDPGAPRLTDATDIVISRRLTLADGRVVGVVDGPDVAVLCAVGRDRFGAWRAAAMTNLRIR